MVNASEHLPGFTFRDRDRLFVALSHLEDRSDAAVVAATVDGRSIHYLREPTVVHAALKSSARKGRSRSSLHQFGGYIGLDGIEFRRARADVVAALRRAARDRIHLEQSFRGAQEIATNGQAVGDLEAAVQLSLTRFLIGEEPNEELGINMRAGLATLEAIEHGTDESGVTGPRSRAISEIASRLSEKSEFVRVLLSRGWSKQRIAAEVVMLTFAGWASLAAAALSGTTLGVTREAATPQRITELLRVAAPGWLVVRETTASVELPGLPMPIPTGELILLSPWFLGRSDKGWPTATCFDDARSGTRRSPWYLPFSSGSRACPAEAFSRAFLEIALGSLPPAHPSEEIRAVLVEGRSACLIPAFEGTGN